MKLTRKQELSLIAIGLKHVLDRLDDLVPNTRVSTRKKFVPWNKGKKTRKWSPAQKEKFQETMRKKWAERKKAK